MTHTQQESSMNTFYRAWKVFEPFHKVIYAVLGFQFFLLVFQFAGPFLYGMVIDNIVSGAPLREIAILVGISALIGLFENAVRTEKDRWEIERFDWKSMRHIDEEISKKLFSLSIGQHRNEHSGMVQGVINDGRSALRDIIFIGMNQTLPVALGLPFAIVAVLWLSPPVGAIVVLGMILYFAITLYINEKFRPEIRKSQEMSRKAGKRVRELHQNAPTVILNSEERGSILDIERRLSERDAHGEKLWARYFIWSNYGKNTIMEITLAAALILAALLASNGALRTGAIVTLMLWVNRIFGDLSSISRMSRMLLEARERAVKYFKLFDVETNVPVSKAPIPLPEVRGQIEFENVSFSYGSEKINHEDGDREPDAPYSALQNASFTIKEGEHVAFVGRSGAGKSTTVLLLLRGQDPSEGKIFIDGLPLTELDPEEYRRHVGMVEQNIVLFDDTIRHNVSFGLGHGKMLSDEEMDHIAKISRIDQFKERLSNGWDTIIGENGVKLSGGERQRVGIARALAKNPAILIFDEATSSLDPENERNIKQAIDEASKGRTVISIAHRLSTIRNADRIFVFEKGKIVDVGTHEELLARSEAYQRQVSGQTVMV